MAFIPNPYVDRTVVVTPGKTVYTIIHQVVTDDLEADPFDAAASLGLNINDPYKSTNCLLKEVNCTNTASDDGCTFYVTCVYDNSPDSNNSVESPFDQPWEREWDAFFEDENIEQDATGKPVLNVCGDPYRDPMQRGRPVSLLSVTGNLPFYNEGTAAAYRGKTNSDSFMGWAPGYVKCLAIKASLQRDANWGDYWRVSYQLGFNSAGWDNWVLELGYNELQLNPDTNKMEKVKITIEDSEGNITYPTEPMLLDRTGKAQKDPAAAQPVFTYYQPHERLPFGGVF